MNDPGTLVAALAALIVSIASVITYFRKRAEKADALIEDKLAAFQAKIALLQKDTDDAAAKCKEITVLRGFVSDLRGEVAALKAENERLRDRVRSLEVQLAAAKAENQTLTKIFKIISPQLTAELAQSPPE